MRIDKSTEKYEAWLGERLPLIATDLSTGRGRRRPARELRRFSPIFGVRDLGAARRSYAPNITAR